MLVHVTRPWPLLFMNKRGSSVHTWEQFLELQAPNQTNQNTGEAALLRHHTQPT